MRDGESPEIRVHWSVVLWGPRAADSSDHSAVGTGATPEEALENLRENVEMKKDLTHAFGAKAREL